MNKVKYILGVQSYSNHDSGACIVKASTDGTILDYFAISEERLIRIKYPYVFPVLSIGACLDYFGLDSMGQIDLLIADHIRVKRWFNSGPAYNASDYDYLKMKFDIDPRKVKVISHHMAHAASTFYASGFDDAAIMIVDGNGSDMETTSFFKGVKKDIILMEQHRCHGIGACYTAVTKLILQLGTGGEGKTMGLAPYGQEHPKVLNITPELRGIRNDFSTFIRRMPYSDVLGHKYNQRINPLKQEYKKSMSKNDLLDPYFSRVAYDIQDTTEKVLVHLAKELYGKTGMKNICIAGGVGLNSVSNKIILDNTDFEKIFIFPACSDAGIPFGLAIWGYYNAKELGITNHKNVVFNNAYTGIEYDDAYVRNMLSSHGIPFKPLDLARVAGLIAEGKIVGWHQGRSEYGPRALGHRSILADPRRKDMKDILNSRVKHRESFRPFAPSILLEHSSEYFDLDCESPYMLLIANVKKPEVVPAITHVDNTARVQTVTREDNGIYYDLVKEFGRLTGVPCLLNTSFNDAGEPMVETPEDALICFMKNNMDALAIGGHMIDFADVNKDSVLPLMERERIERLAKRRQDLLVRLFPGYNEQEKETFLEEANKIAEWHTKYRSKYELEKMTNKWVEEKAKILIIGTKDHTALLPKVINQFGDLNIVGFINFDSKYDRDAAATVPYPEYKMDQISSIPYDALLVSSWEYNFDIESVLRGRGIGNKMYVIYDNASRSFLDTLSAFPAFKYNGLC
ncbi:hypothetical protein HYS47_05205 [Candidatus Woesearchaeota archaeon]|nr:hypothetical protein [Candidatus Woesearchaeota archaeon]